MTVQLYTLPTCGICHIMKVKMQQKNINFIEKNFEEIMNIIHTDRAPALEIINDNGETVIYNSPSQIVDWINQQ